MVIETEQGRGAEFELLLQCARTRLGPPGRERMEGLIQGGLQWKYLIQLARYHGVVPLLYHHLKARADGAVPDEALGALRGIAVEQSVRGLALVREAGRLSRTFEAEGLRVLSMKGASLAEKVYGGIALRPFVDVDLLVSPDDFGRLERHLLAEGYRRRAMGPFHRAGYLLIHAQYTFWKRADLPLNPPFLALDVHTDVMPVGYSYSEDFADLWDRSEPLALGGGTVRVLASEDLLSVLCYHGFKNRWGRLKYFSDVAELVRATPDLDWDVVEGRAEAMRSRRVLLLGLVLAHEVLEAPVPERFLGAARADRRVMALSWEVVERLPHEAHIRVEPYWDRVRLNLLAQDSFLGQLRYSGYALLRRLSDFVFPEADT